MHAILSSFALVLVAELGDKTQLLAFSLATRFRRPWAVLGGILVATLVNHALAAAVGRWVGAHVPARGLAVGLGLLFVAFGLWMLVPDREDGHAARPSRLGPFLTTALLFFVAEMGDKTQLATMALGARFDSPVLVTLGTTAGMLVADGLAVALGARLAERVQARAVRVVAALVFVAFGVASLLRAA